MPYVSIVCVIVYVIGHAVGPSMYPLATSMVSVTHVVLSENPQGVWMRPQVASPLLSLAQDGEGVISTMG